MEKKYHAIMKSEGAALVEQYLMRGGNYQFCWHKPMEIMLILKGTAEVFAHGKRYLLEQNDMLLINSNSGHSTFFRDLDCIVFICEIAPAFFQKYFSQEINALQIDCVSSAENRDSTLFIQLRFLLSKSFQYAFGDTELAQRLSLQYMTTLISELMLHFPTNITQQKQGKGKEKEALQIVMEYIETNYSQKLSLEQAATHVQYNRTYLSTLFKRSTGILFNDYIIRVRLRHALEALADLDRSIVSIALDYGFPDSKSFSSSMKKYCGRTPQEYRFALKQNPTLRILQGADKYLQRPDPETETLIEQYCGVAALNRGKNERMENTSLLKDYCGQLDEIVQDMKRFL